jgi:alpha-methylacyl-CoA racemase
VTTGPLVGMRVVEFAGIGPGPFAGMLLADLGADVVRVDRIVPGGLGEMFDPHTDVLGRGRRSIALDLKDPAGLDIARRLADGADALLEGFRPGVMENLGLGPDRLLARNPRLVYARMTGWGQEGLWAQRAGHDIDYAALAGALHPIGPGDRPPAVPLNFIADFGGGGMLLVVGMLAALLERERSGAGQVVDAAMVDGAALQTSAFHGLMAMGLWTTRRESNLLDGGAHFYRTYRCADGEFIAVGALERQFYAELIDRLGLDPDDWPQADPTRWPELRGRMAEVFASRTRDEWMEVFEGSDACVAPVLSLADAPDHPHVVARGTYTDVAGIRQPAAAPRFSRTPGGVGEPTVPGAHTDELLAELGVPASDIAVLRQAGAVG